MKTITGLLACLGTAWVLGACSGDSQGDSSGGSPSSTEPGEVAAMVNDEPITVAEVSRVARNFVVQGLQPDLGAQGDTHEARMYYTVVDRLIEQKLINQDVSGRGVVIGEEEVAQGVSQLKAMAGGEQAFLKVLSENNITIEDVERDTRTNLAVKNFYENAVPEATVSENEIVAFYNENAMQWEPKPEVHARHILIRTQPGQDDMQQAEIRRRAAEILKIAQESPDFAAVARDHSEDETTAPTGGDLSWFGQGRMVPPFDSAAFALEPGEISGLVETQFGYHIIKVEETRMSEAISLDQVRPQIQAQLTQQKGQEAFVKAVQDLRAAAKVEIHPPSAEILAELSGS